HGGGPAAGFRAAVRSAAADLVLGGVADRPGRRHLGRRGVPRRAGEHARRGRPSSGPVPAVRRHWRGWGGGRCGGGGGVVVVLWLCLCKLDLDDVLSTTAQLACVVGVAAVCDIVRDDAGLIAAILMGLAVANMRDFDVPDKRPFFETLVQLIIGVLFVAISAT